MNSCSLDACMHVELIKLYRAKLYYNTARACSAIKVCSLLMQERGLLVCWEGDIHHIMLSQHSDVLLRPTSSYRPGSSLPFTSRLSCFSHIMASFHRAPSVWGTESRSSQRRAFPIQ